MSLYRKYRPQNFENLVGQEHVSTTLTNALKSNRTSHAYLFTGPRGTGKTTTARIMAKSINCINLKDGAPCEECDICRDINEGKLMDVIEIDAASNRGIESMNDLKEKITFAPTRARNKVYIIDEVHMLTKDSFNALLKTLEEPPEKVFFILATTEVHKIPETILSRCQRFDFKRIELKTMVERLKFIAEKEGFSVEDKALEMICDHAQGGMRDAIGLMEQLTSQGNLTYDHVCSMLGISGYASMEKLYGHLCENNTVAGLEEIHGLFSEGFDLVNFNKNFLEYLRKRMIESVEKNEGASTGRVLRYINLFSEAYEQSRHTPIAQLPLELAVVQAGFAVQQSAAPVAAPAIARQASAPVSSAPVNSSAQTQAVPVSPPERQHAGLQSTQAATQVSSPSVEKPTAPSVPGQFTVAELKKKWIETIKNCKIPAAKNALMAGHPLKSEGCDITIGFASNFYMDKIKEAANRADVEEAFFKVLGVRIKVISELSAPPQKSESDAAANALADNVLEIMGGTVV